MLDEYKKSYEELANFIDDWKKKSSQELCQLYIDNLNINKYKAECYLSALICRYWYIISRTYYAQRVKIASQETVYDWFIEGLYNAVKHHVWTNPNNSLYNDNNAVEKAISVCIYSVKLNYFQSLEYDKRKVGKFSLSLEELQENASDNYYLPYSDKSPYMEMYMQDKVKNLFNNYDYFSAFLLDAIVNSDVFIKEKDDTCYSLSIRKLIKYLRNIDNRYIKIFSNLYNLKEEEVRKASDFIKNLSSDRMIRNINNLLFVLKHDKELITYLKS